MLSWHRNENPPRKLRGGVLYSFSTYSDINIALRGYEPIACLTPLQAVRRVFYRLYDGVPLPSTLQPNKTQKQSERNAEIRRRHAAGESLVDLAQEYDLSKQRIHQI